jgi:alpha-tubulin suppressor-like RCC1 family protein
LLAPAPLDPHTPATANGNLAAADFVQSGAVSVSAGASHTCARFANGAVSCWGANNKGQLATGSTTGSNTAVPSQFTGAVEVEAGGDVTCILNNAGERWCAGGEYH